MKKLANCRNVKQAIYRFIYHKLLGWKAHVTVPDYKKYILCAAPHTSNWDLIIGKLFYGAIGRHANFMMKKEWFFWPLGGFFRRMGGIPVDRQKKSSLVEQMAQAALSSEVFRLTITPEATRSSNPDWKRGFYYIAMQAKIPILLVGLDYEKKCITIEREFTPSGDIEKDMREIKRYFTQFKGKHPERFSTGVI